MTGVPPSRDPDTQPIKPVGSGERKRAAMALGVLGVAALALVIVMVYVFGKGDNNAPTTSGTGIALPTGPPVTVTGGQHPPKSQSRSEPRHRHSSPSSPQPSSSFHGPVACPSAAPCSLPQDVGNVIGAFNAFRTSHGLKALPGRVTQAARSCALGNGDTSSCPSGYFWEPVGRSGTQVIQKIATASNGTSFLLDKSMTAFEVGWAYSPSSHGFECAVIADH